VLISGLGATPIMELYILFAEVRTILERSGIRIHRSYVGNYFTSLEMAGATVTVMRLDAELRRYLDLSADTVGLRQFGVDG